MAKSYVGWRFKGSARRNFEMENPDLVENKRRHKEYFENYELACAISFFYVIGVYSKERIIEDLKKGRFRYNLADEVKSGNKKLVGFNMVEIARYLKMGEITRITELIDERERLENKI